MASHSVPMEPTSNSLRAPAGGGHLSRTCATVLDSVQHVLDARSAWIFVRESGSGMLVAADARGDGAAAFAGARIPHDRGVVGLSYSHRETVFAPEPSQDDRWFDCESVHRAKLAAVVFVPILAEHEAIGVLGLEVP